MVDSPPLVRPVEGPVTARFSYDRAAPFEPGRRRIVRFSAGPGSRVAAPCAGRVTHAGRVPGGRAVSLRCGVWSVTLTGVDPRTARGRRVPAGATVARAAGAVGLGLRRAADPFGYVDPLPLMGDAPVDRVVPLGRAPRGRSPVRRAPPARPLPRASPAPAVRAPVPAARPGVRAPVPAARPAIRAPVPVARPAIRAPVPAARPAVRAPVLAARPAVPVTDPPSGVPWPAWGGLALAALGLPAGAVRIRVRRRAARATAARVVRG